MHLLATMFVFSRLLLIILTLHVRMDYRNEGISLSAVAEPAAGNCKSAKSRSPRFGRAGLIILGKLFLTLHSAAAFHPSFARFCCAPSSHPWTALPHGFRAKGSLLSAEALASLPLSIVDCHHHFIAPDQPFHAALAEIGAPMYTAEQYKKDCGQLPITKTVHVEAMADDGVGEVAHVEALINSGKCKVAAIVANCDLSAPDAAQQLDRIMAASTRVRGIRKILDYDGPFDGNRCTHMACKFHDTDYLRDPVAAVAFERGFALLADRGLSFDLQCCPAQMDAAESLFRRHPKVPVCIDHLGKLWRLKADGGDEDAAKIAAWRTAMIKLATLPQVYCKISMLGNVVQGWPRSSSKEALLKSLVLEVIDLFGAKRCMFNSNWHINGSISNSDVPGVASDEDLSMEKLFEKFASWVAHLPNEDREWLFARSAEEFYSI